MRKRISYDIQSSAPGWPGNPKIEFETITSIKEGDICNQYVFSMFNHFGSHMDGARHFNDNGRRLCEEPFDMFFFDVPCLIDVPKKAAEPITQKDLENYAEQIESSDLLMIRTGFSGRREEEPAVYAEQGPYVSGEAAKYLMDHFRGSLKAIALDFISLGSPAAPEEAVKAHQYMLGLHHNNACIGIIEDVDFTGLSAEHIKSAAAIPLFIEVLDSTPITMWVEL